VGVLGWLLTSAGGYLSVSLLGYRLQYIRTFKKYRRWQLAAPNERARFDRGQYGRPGHGNVPRKNLEYRHWFDCPDASVNDSDFPPQFMFLWPVCLVVVVGDKILHPKIKLPDPQKINEIEAEEEDDLALALAKAERDRLCGPGPCVC
jgi:hypothetical protein